MKRIPLSCFLILVMHAGSFAQQFTEAGLSTIKPSQIIIENYTVVILSKEIIDDPMANRFDPGNPYTYLQLIDDGSANKFHILYQTNFLGKIIYLGYSNNLSGIFNKEKKPMFLFVRCLRGINNHLSSAQIAAEAVKCIIERLNYCAESN